MWFRVRCHAVLFFFYKVQTFFFKIAMQSTHRSAADCWADFSKFKVSPRLLCTACHNNTGVTLRQLEAFLGGHEKTGLFVSALSSLSRVVVIFF